MNDKVSAKIVEIMGSGITDKAQVRSLLRRFVMHDLFKDMPPDLINYSYFPLDTDIAKHIYMAKRACM